MEIYKPLYTLCTGTNELLVFNLGKKAEQGQTLNRVEDTIQNAQEYVEKAKVQTAKAVEHQKSSNKKCCCCIGLLVILLAVIGISIAISLA